jgi:hypothetical protein
LRRYDAYKVTISAFQSKFVADYRNFDASSPGRLHSHQLVMRDRGHALPHGVANSFSERKSAIHPSAG